MGRVEVERGELAACCCSYVFLVRHRDVPAGTRYEAIANQAGT